MRRFVPEQPTRLVGGERRLVRLELQRAAGAWHDEAAGTWLLQMRSSSDAFGARGRRSGALAGGVSVAQQALAAKLVDEVVLHVVPKLVGRGVPLFGAGQVNLRCTEAIRGEGAVHLRYEVQ